MKKIHIISGDALKPNGAGVKIIAHVCNNVGAWGSGFVISISKKWKKPEQAYKNLGKWKLGTVQYVPVEKDIVIANMIAQDGIKPKDNIPPIRYDALRKCLEDVAIRATMLGHGMSSVHAPYMIGCVRGGGDWNEVKRIFSETLIENDIDTYFYKLG